MLRIAPVERSSRWKLDAPPIGCATQRVSWVRASMAGPAWGDSAGRLGPAQGDQVPRRSRSALAITEAELRLIASAATIGDSSQPVNGNSSPAASGTPSAL